MSSPEQYIRTPQPIEAMRETLPRAFSSSWRRWGGSRSTYRDMQDIEFTVEDES